MEQDRIAKETLGDFNLPVVVFQDVKELNCVFTALDDGPVEVADQDAGWDLVGVFGVIKTDDAIVDKALLDHLHDQRVFVACAVWHGSNADNAITLTVHACLREDHVDWELLYASSCRLFETDSVLVLVHVQLHVAVMGIAELPRILLVDDGVGQARDVYLSGAVLAHVRCDNREG